MPKLTRSMGDEDEILTTEKSLLEASSDQKGRDTVDNQPKINELDSDWDDYMEGILYYGLESWEERDVRPVSAVC